MNNIFTLLANIIFKMFNGLMFINFLIFTKINMHMQYLNYFLVYFVLSFTY